ncbi:unnamed protein product [Amoebophrya sp. A120]|nr:unnamed protein product [Amoebophrya sp. A120]|eukprot:GSA120T00016556001.1
MPEQSLAALLQGASTASSSSSFKHVSSSDGNVEEEDLATRTDYTFHYLPDAKFRMWTDRGFQMLLTKWGFGESMCIGKWRFEEKVEPGNREQGKNLVTSFFKSETNRAALQALGVSVLAPAKLEVEVEDISTAETSMRLFEKLEECGAVGKTGHIKGRLDEFVNDVVVNSLIREVFYMEESDLYDVYTEKDRKEFILRIFQHLQIGGATNQYEDDIGEYLKATKALYRDLVSVRKKDDGEPEVTSMVFEVTGFNGQRNGGLFKRDHTTNYEVHEKYRTSIDCITNFGKKKRGIRKNTALPLPYP